jgi:hypothetical protein
MKEEIEKDEAINNEELIAAEYDITVDVATGKVFIASNLDGSEVIIQGIMPAYRKDNPTKGAETIAFDRENVIEGCNAYFTGNVYFERIPCTTVVNGTKEGTKTDVVIEEATVISEDKVEAKEDVKTDEVKYPDLAKNKPKIVVAPSGLSRTQRKDWWSALRKMYPEAFDVTGNYIGYGKVEQKEESTEQKAITTALTEVKAEKPAAKVDVPLVTDFKNVGVGAGNCITTMADHKVRASFFMGQYFPSKDSYSVLSAPAKIFDNAPYIFVNKERTADMFLAGLRKSPSFTKLLNGHETVVPATVLKNTVFTDKFPVYYVTNVVTALQALGLQEIAQEKTK